jgi:hypothetical protein
MNWNSLDSIDWDDLETTADWMKLLNDLRGLIDSASDSAKRGKLADALDEFAELSPASNDPAAILKADASARSAARALRNWDSAERIAILAAASADYQSAVKEFASASAGLKKEAAFLRAEKVTASIGALTETISSLKNLSQVIDDKNDAKLVTAVDEAVKSAKKLRDILEKPA